MTDNGILEQVPGEYTAEASKTLPPAETAEDRDYAVDINASHVRRLCIFYPAEGQARQVRHWFWLAVRAERV